MSSLPHTPPQPTFTPIMPGAPIYSGHRRAVLQANPPGGSFPHDGPVSPSQIYNNMSSLPYGHYQYSAMAPNIQHAGVYSGHVGSAHRGPIHSNSVPHGGRVHGGHVPNEANLRRGSVQNPRPPPFTSTEDGIEIMIENDGKESNFIVHRCLLTEFSPYFRGLLAEKEPERKNTVVKGFEKVHLTGAGFDFVTPVVMGAFVEWLDNHRTGRVFPRPGSTKVNSTCLIHLWVLADRLGVQACQNSCIEGMERLPKQNKAIETSMLQFVYDNTKHYSRGMCPLRNLFVDQCAWGLDAGWILSHEDIFPKECLVDIVAKLRNIVKYRLPGATGELS